MSVAVSQTLSISPGGHALNGFSNGAIYAAERAPSPTESRSFRSCKGASSTLKVQQVESEELGEQPLRTRDENARSRPPSHCNVEDSNSTSKFPLALSEACQVPPRRASTRSVRTVLTFRDTSSNLERDASARLPVPPPDDPIIARAVESSMDLGKERAGPQSSTAEHVNPNAMPTNPFKRLVTTIHRKRQSKRAGIQSGNERSSLDQSDGVTTTKWKGLKHKKSTSWQSSSGIITAVKSAKFSLSTFAEPSLSIKVHGPPPALGNRSRARRSHSFSRNSTESTTRSVQGSDDALRGRAIKRRQILVEVMMSEERYIADLKMLLNASHPFISK